MLILLEDVPYPALAVQTIVTATMAIRAQGYAQILEPLFNVVRFAWAGCLTDAARQFLDLSQMPALCRIEFVVHLMVTTLSWLLLIRLRVFSIMRS